VKCAVAAKNVYEPPSVQQLTLSRAKAIFRNHVKEFLELIFPGRLANRDTSAMVQTGEQYQKPAVRRLTPEQAKLLLIGHASVGNRGARDILELLYPPESADSRRECT